MLFKNKHKLMGGCSIITTLALSVVILSCNKQTNTSPNTALNNNKVEQGIIKKVLKNAAYTLSYSYSFSHNGQSGGMQFSNVHSSQNQFSNVNQGNSFTSVNRDYFVTVSSTGFTGIDGGQGEFTLDDKNVKLDYVFCGDISVVFGGTNANADLDEQEITYTSIIGVKLSNQEVEYIVQFMGIGDGANGEDVGLDEICGATSGDCGSVTITHFADVVKDSTGAEIGPRMYFSHIGEATVTSNSVEFDDVDMRKDYAQDPDGGGWVFVEASGFMECE